MGTTTFYLKHNDFGKSLGRMAKKELNKLDQLSPYKEEKRFLGWNTPLELHNGNVNVLVWWEGRLMRLEEAPKELDKKCYDRYKGKTRNEYEWTLLKRFLHYKVNALDKEFKKHIKKKKRKQHGSGKNCH